MNTRVTAATLRAMALREEKDRQTVKIEEIMKHPAGGVEKEEPIEAVLTTMTLHRRIRVPVVRHGKLVSIFAWADVLSPMLEAQFVPAFSLVWASGRVSTQDLLSH